MYPDAPIGIPAPLLLAFVGVASLIVGSFLNVVITRIPLMLERDERRWSLNQLHIQTPSQPTLNLLLPRSFCLACKQPIPLQHLVPVFSWLFLRGRCNNCHHPIKVRYLVVEILAVSFALALFPIHGLSMDFCFKLIFCYLLIAIAFMDWETGWLPNSLTLPLIGGGLLHSALSPWSPYAIAPIDAIIGLTIGYLLLWLLNYIYRTLKSRDAIGQGDFMLVAAMGAWFGWALLPLLLVVAATVALAIGLILLLRGTYSRQEGIRFGPFLSMAGIAFLFLRDGQWLPNFLVV